MDSSVFVVFDCACLLYRFKASMAIFSDTGELCVVSVLVYRIFWDLARSSAGLMAPMEFVSMWLIYFYTSL